MVFHNAILVCQFLLKHYYPLLVIVYDFLAILTTHLFFQWRSQVYVTHFLAVLS